MTEQSKTRKVEKQVENLELNRETIEDLTEEQAERVEGGMARARSEDPDCRCTAVYTGC
jgi:hypothetical protein